jgi:Flp pilus assembly protein TadD
LNPNHLELLKKAQALDLAGQAEKASAAYREFLVQEPKHAIAWADHAGQLLKLGHLEEARQACAAALAIDPRQAAALINLGCVLMRQAQLREAEAQFRVVLGQEPGRMDAKLLLAECLLNRRDLPNAKLVLDETRRPGAMGGRYAVLRARQAQLWAVLGSALFEQEQFEEAEAACQAALQLDPGNVSAQSNLGALRMVQGRLEDAETRFRRLLADHPGDESIRLRLISCLSRMGHLTLADQEIRTVLQQEPSDLVVHSGVMATYYDLGRWPEFRAEIERFRKADPASDYPDWEQSGLDLLFGDMAQGWARYEVRLKLPKEWWPQRSFTQPAWDGGPFAGKTLLLWPEQGLGDFLMFIRYLPLVKELGGRVILQVPRTLMDLAATCSGADLSVPFGAPLPPFDLQASLLSLPWLFRTELASIPAEVPYLDVPDQVPHRRALLDCLNQAKGSTRIGLVWAGNPVNSRNLERSLPPAALAPLAALSDAAWFSFQVGREAAPPLPNLTPLAPLLGNFSDTAYALSGMDLVITVDTAVAHLAGALGIPTLLLLAFQADFRWLRERDDSPWYPSMRLYRQPAYGDWASVLRQVVADLTQES